MKDDSLLDIERAFTVLDRSFSGETYDAEMLLQVKALCYVYDEYAVLLSKKFNMRVDDFMWRLDEALNMIPR